MMTEELVRNITEKRDLRHPGGDTGKTIGGRGDAPGPQSMESVVRRISTRPAVRRLFTSLVLHSKYCSCLALVLALK